MKSTQEIENKLKQLKPILQERFLVDKIGFFGSYSNCEQNELSDLDIYVELKKPIGWSFFTMEKFLEEQFGMKIDLVTPNALKKQIKEQILNQIRFV